MHKFGALHEIIEVFAKLSPSPSSNWAVAGSIPSFSVRPSGRPSRIVLFRPSMTLASKVKLFISIVRLQKYVQTLTLIVLGVIQP